MPYCKNCGKELNPAHSFCKFCGTKVEKDNLNVASGIVNTQTPTFVNNVAQQTKNINFIDNFKAFEQKNFFIATIVSLFLDFVLQFSEMVEYNFYITGGKLSVFKLFELAYTYDFNDASYDLFRFLFRLSPIFLIVAFIIIVIPMLTGKEYSKKYFIAAKLATIYTSIIYILFLSAMAYTYKNESELVSVGFWGVFYCIVSVAVIVVVFKFAKTMKKTKNKQ